MAPAAWKVGDLVYIPSVEKDNDVAFHAGTILEIPRGSTEVAVQLVSQNDTRTVAQSALRRRFVRGDDSTSQDNTSLVHLNDATILENLEARHKKDEIYTYTASVLLAMNPYRDIDGLYGEEMCAAYRGKHIGALAPHPYAIADTAFRALVRDRKNQGFIISGESGAGKTETAKIVMQYLGFVSGTSSDLATKIQKRVVQAQPILESFGNAVTMRNNNSSRFGKYNRIYFDDKGTLVDASVTTYLLESSRVVVHSGRERTYHCFYEMLSGLKPEQLASLHLEPDQRYRLLASESDVPQKEEEQWMKQFQDRDARNFKRLCEAFTVVGLNEEDINNCFRVLAGLIHLGDLASADCKEENGEVDNGNTVELNEQSLAWAAELLGMDADELGGALKRRKVCVPGRNSFHEAPRTPAQFRHALHSLIKALYKRIFERTVQRINVSFQELSGGAQAAEGGDACHIGILDIYGFERLQRNSFEQLCINLANERLQQYFVENVLVAEQALYEREGLPWIGLTLPDSTPVVSAIGNIFETLDDFSQRQAKGIAQTTDERFCQKTVQDATKDSVRKEVLKQVKMSNKRGTGECLGMDQGFVIKHYAGEVVYNTKGWLDKNNDCLLQECESLICNSSFDFVASLGEEDNIKGKVPFRSISKKYSADLKNLLDTLSTCQLHYIRCFKPNAFQKPHIFNQNLVLDQIIQCGTIELVKIMHDGYPNRCLFEDMVNRFRDMLPPSFQRYGLRTFIEALMLAYDVPKDEWALGMSRLFLKAGQLKALEDMRSEGAAPDPEKLKEIVSGIIRKKWIRAKNAVQVCNFIPKFLQEVYATKAAKALCMQALVMAKLQPKLLAARQRVQQRRLMARRRIKAVFFTARLAKSLMDEARAKRKARLQKAMHLYWMLQTRLRPAVEGARARAAEAELRREAERRREQERMAAEQAEAMRKIEEDRLKMEAELASQKKALEEQRQAEEEKKRQDEQTRLDNIAAKERELAEKQRRLEEERKQMEEEKVGQGRQSILAGATPQGNRMKSRGGEQDECDAGDVDDVEAADSVSVRGSNPQMDRVMDERIKELEREMQRKQNEIMAQMEYLQARNAELERKFEQGLEPYASPPLRCGRDCNSPLPMDSPGQDAAPSTPPSGSRQSLPSASRARRSSMHGRESLKGGKRRQSVAHEALQLEAGVQPLGDAAGRQDGSQAVHFKRKWWAEQRQFLLEDLFPGGQSPTPGRGNRRASMGGGNDSSLLADQGRQERRATQPIPEVEQESC
eukprot:TRINITY_DN1903_c0_g1_i3.p1 TRINITY_DN1903_c0_g1~~TRINITY_DN1903_c0_g1_i3.p1  ORF type:complete len:1260 (-),score=358.72 TRINITY_DN1903_c0_g1_i3:147-3926(-)